MRKIETISIGGEAREVRLKMITVNKILILYNKVWYLAAKGRQKELGRELREDDSVVIPNFFYFWSIWKILVKKRVWPFRRPFRSRRKMIKEILADEFASIVSFIGEKVLNVKSEDKEPGNGNSLQSQSSMTG